MIQIEEQEGAGTFVVVCSFQFLIESGNQGAMIGQGGDGIGRCQGQDTLLEYALSLLDLFALGDISVIAHNSSDIGVSQQVGAGAFHPAKGAILTADAELSAQALTQFLHNGCQHSEYGFPVIRMDHFKDLAPDEFFWHIAEYACG